MIRVNVQSDIESITAKLKATAKQARTAANRALNRTAARVRTYSAREIRAAGYNIKANAIKRNILVVQSHPGTLFAIVRPIGKPIPLIDYGARFTRRAGVTVRVKNGTKVLSHAFIATMPNGHKGVFQRGSAARVRYRGITARRSRGDHRAGRLPIVELFGPGVPQAFANEVVANSLKKNVEVYFPLEMTRQLTHVLDVAGG